MHKAIEAQIGESISVKQQLLKDEALIAKIEEAAQCIIAAYRSKHKTLLAGNGGSAADAQHIAGELVSRFYFDRPALPSIAITTNSSNATAISNDYGFNSIFSRQLEALGTAGDVFIGLSTSGNSANLMEAMKVARQLGITTIGLTGQTGGAMAELCDICLKVPSTETPRIQESHILIGHILCYLVEDALFAHLKPQQ